MHYSMYPLYYELHDDYNYGCDDYASEYVECVPN